MKLESLEIAGFKSFANRKKITFSDNITAIVGPNGSGKSNIAEAIRWVLGEQRNRNLRTLVSEDVIFHGSDKKPRASMAQVSLELVSSKVSNQTQTNFSRILFRSGESEYTYNGKKTQLNKIEHELATVGFGAKTYTVIGQGMIERLVLSSAQERKLLFDEASGIRKYDLKRELAQRNLNTALKNLDTTNEILKELEPTTALLESQIQDFEKIENLKRTLRADQENYLHYQKSALESSIAKLQERQIDATHILTEIQRKLDDASKKTASLQKSTQSPGQLIHLEKKSDKLKEKHLKLTALLENLSQQKDESLELDKKIKLKNEIKSKVMKSMVQLRRKHKEISSRAKKLEASIHKINNTLTSQSKDFSEIQAKLKKNQKSDFVNHASGLVSLVRVQLRKVRSRSEIDVTLQKLSDILEQAQLSDPSELVLELSRYQKSISNLMDNREDLNEKHTKLILQLRAIELDISSFEINTQELDSEIKQLNTKQIQASKIEQSFTTTQEELKKCNLEIESVAVRINKARGDSYTDPKKSNSILDDIISNTEQKTKTKIELSRIAEDIAKNKTKIRDLHTLAQEWFGSTYKIRATNSKNRSVDINTITTHIAQINSSSTVNSEVLQEAQASRDRIDFLISQKKDLEAAIKDAQKIVDSLKVTMSKHFTAAFAKINQEFQKYFSELFSGGEAGLSLTIDKEGRSEIEILIRLPEKRLKSIQAMSGGEKSMASLALIAAIISANPSPFIVLDEVDAALDEQNSMAFISILKRLSKKSQIIVITHNIETMQAADTIIGVTTSQKGDSEILELSMAESSKYAL